ncbi:unnamed protein product [Rotaria socialis]|uniref:Transposase Tc1-like domain-containing protein n=1 Tax=Rotaria socialis TaxID=392032 RepID=A0A818V5N1_9BILA|nr:unnamed protein product [Rotaria socialis]CAF3701609.1 unnamed protein product [Rotaria socialis]CAF3712530.1 unnamed protein product [Rotaria socialis]
MKGRGRKRKTTAAVDRIIQCIIEGDRRKSAASVKQEFEKEIGVIIHSNTVRNRIHEIGLYGRAGPKKTIREQAQSSKTDSIRKNNDGKAVQLLERHLVVR